MEKCISLYKFRKKFLESDMEIADISMYGDVPEEISSEDVYDYTMLFKNEEIAVNYVCENNDVSRQEIMDELHEEDWCREKYGKEKYLRSAQIKIDLYISELLDGTYILWRAY